MSENITERDLFFPLLCGPRGVRWLYLDEPISKDNPVLFTCAYCRKTLVAKDGKLTSKHEKGCRIALLNKLGL